jgi:hypothetical protein
VNIRVFDDATKKSVYAAQTAKAQTTGKSNSPLLRHVKKMTNKNKI